MKKKRLVIIILIIASIIILSVILVSVLVLDKMYSSSNFLSSEDLTEKSNSTSNSSFSSLNTTGQELNLKEDVFTCKIFNERTFFSHRGGNTSQYQENTIEIFLDSAMRGRNIEMDLMFLGDGNIIVFHDSNTLEKTGVSIDLSTAIWEQINSLTYLSYIEGVQYSSTPRIPLLSQALEAICKINNETSIWFDIKYAYDFNFISKLMETVDNSPCACNNRQHLVFEIYRDINALVNLRFSMASQRCQYATALSFYDNYVDKTYEEIKEELYNFAPYADVFDYHTSIVQEYPDILNLNYNNSICNSLYNDDNKMLKPYFNNSKINLFIYNFDE